MMHDVVNVYFHLLETTQISTFIQDNQEFFWEDGTFWGKMPDLLHI